MKDEETIIKTIRTVYQTEEFIGFYNSLPATVQKLSLIHI